MRPLKTGRRPPIYPKTPGHLPCSSLTHPLPLPSRRPSVSFGGFGFTQYAQGPDRETAVRSALKWDARVDFIDKLASTEEVVLRLRRLIGTVPDVIRIGSRISLDLNAQVVYVTHGRQMSPVYEIHGMRFKILRELALTWYRGPGELVPLGRLERFSEGENASASVRVRIRQIKDSLGEALGLRFGAADLIVNVREHGYRLVPP